MWGKNTTDVEELCWFSGLGFGDYPLEFVEKALKKCELLKENPLKIEKKGLTAFWSTKWHKETVKNLDSTLIEIKSFVETKLTTFQIQINLNRHFTSWKSFNKQKALIHSN